jgi:hypothetical protein
MGKADKAIARAQNAKDFKHANPGWCRMPTIPRILYPFPANSKFSFYRQGGCPEWFHPCKPLASYQAGEAKAVAPACEWSGLTFGI